MQFFDTLMAIIIKKYILNQNRRSTFYIKIHVEKGTLCTNKTVLSYVKSAFKSISNKYVTFDIRINNYKNNIQH